MTRTIKFRGKRLDNGEWVYGSLAETHGKLFIGISTDPDNPVYMMDWHEVDPATVGQFTGLLDKSGKEIYEGDVLGCLEDEDFLPEIVIFKDGCFMAEDSYTTIAMNTIDTEYRTIIGNIHDDPELVKKLLKEAADAIVSVCADHAEFSAIIEQPKILSKTRHDDILKNKKNRK